MVEHGCDELGLLDHAALVDVDPAEDLVDLAALRVVLPHQLALEVFLVQHTFVLAVDVSELAC